MDNNPQTDLAVGPPFAGTAPGCSAMRKTEILHQKLSANLPLIVFLGFYFATTVLANFIYHTDLGEAWAQSIMIEGDFSNLPLMRTPGYWILLLMPFLIVPPLAIYFAHALQGLTSKLTSFAPEFRRPDYLVITGVAYAYCYYAFRRSNVIEILGHAANDVYGSVAARFEIAEALGFWPLMVMKSILIFLAVYSLVRAMRSREWFWIVAFLINLIVLSEMLVLLNMKWPVLIYYLALVLCILLFSPRHPYLNTAISAIGLGAVYLVISVMVLRFAEAEIASRQIAARPAFQTSTTQPPAKQAGPKPGDSLNEQETLSAPAPINMLEYATTVARKAVSLTPLLVTNAVNRMALPYPFYYQVFTETGQVCGTIFDRILRKTNPCHPSNLIYEKIYGQGQFRGKATAPAAVHITGYALGGWSGAVIVTILASIVIGMFMGLWQSTRTSALAATVFVMGGYSAYFFSQLPFEGPIVYDHGIVWWTVVVLGYAGYRLLLEPVLSNAVFAPIGRWTTPVLASISWKRRFSGSDSKTARD